MTDVYKQIKERRTQLGLTQEELAKKVGYTDRSSIAKIESGQVDLSQSKLEQFADVLGTTASELMGDPATSESGYYFDTETEMVLQAYFESPGMRMLFDAARDLDQDDLVKVTNMVKAYKGDD